MTRTAPPERLLDRRIALARAALFWECLWPRLALPLGIVVLFLAASLLDLWAFMPWQAHLAALLVVLAGLGALSYFRLRGLAWPDRAEGRRRLELKSGLTHRPLELLEDRLAGDPQDPGTRHLWQAYQRRMAARIGQIRIGWPEAGLARHDPWGLRAVIGLVLVVGLGVAGAEAPQRLYDGIYPDIGGERRASVMLDAWIGPPAYTSLPPLFLARDGKPLASPAAVAVPVGSTLLARVHGTRRAPTLRIDGRAFPFSSLDPQNFQANKPLEAAKKIEIVAGQRTLGTWTVAMVPDHLPEVSFTTPPKGNAQALLTVAYTAKDDYGLKRVALELSRSGNEPVHVIDLPLSAVTAKEAAESSDQDLRAHRWAGRVVTARLVAEDAIGQIGSSEPVELTLPERLFQHPVARAVIEQRRLLVDEPPKRNVVAAVLAALALAPEAYNNDMTAHLGLRTARTRLQNDKSEAATQGVFDLLWDVAIRIEDGNLSEAEQALRNAEQALQEALSRDASDAEIEKLIRELRQAMDRYMQALAQDALEKGELQEADEMDPDQEYMTSDDLQKMIDRARDLAKKGAKDAAKDMLSQLRQMLESMKNGRVAKAPSEERQERQRRGNEAMRELGDMMRKQQELMDRSFRQNRERQNGQQQQGRQGQGDAGEQEALRQRLREFMRRFGQDNNQMGQAEDQMGRAGDALRQGEPGQATGPQGQALDLMRQGAQAMMQGMGSEYGEGGPDGDPRNDRNDRADSGRREDPLGRDLNSPWEDGLSTKVPTESEAQRSREILEELYRRSAERNRPPLERDYIDRLLRRF